MSISTLAITWEKNRHVFQVFVLLYLWEGRLLSFLLLVEIEPRTLSMLAKHATSELQTQPYSDFLETKWTQSPRQLPN